MKLSAEQPMENPVYIACTLVFSMSCGQPLSALAKITEDFEFRAIFRFRPKFDDFFSSPEELLAEAQSSHS